MLSPILWQLNTPDRFDMYSAGVMLLQVRACLNPTPETPRQPPGDAHSAGRSLKW